MQAKHSYQNVALSGRSTPRWLYHWKQRRRLLSLFPLSYLQTEGNYRWAQVPRSHSA